ncbi:ATP-grasp fold amidoligase family protein [Gephyromycinifex aptenodytis]|uniref:ATP-grasp fold amidoligase family protein n=1 Tax=Gephyromycinifex aptenodytis TaxID=2716227 RepID=UPI00144607B5|nr:ATP-grasp fold amidoligase family protein [Gephyromycinifex aptenodytis]
MEHRSLTARALGRIAMLTRRARGRWATEAILRHRYRQQCGRDLDLDHPLTMTDKIYARMLLIDRHRDESVTALADKYLVRQTIAEVVGETHLVPLLWQGGDPAQIPFDDLPTPAILKPNHLTGSLITITPELDRAWAVRHARGWLRESMYWPAREYQYHPITRRLIVEAFIDDGQPNGPLDYSVWCFHGRAHLVQIRDRSKELNYFVDTNFVRQQVYADTNPDVVASRPRSWDRLLECAAALAAPFEFVRVDLYDVHGHVYVGELTFTPARGRLRFASPEWDARLGALWHFDPGRPVLPHDAPDAFRPSPTGPTR